MGRNGKEEAPKASPKAATPGGATRCWSLEAELEMLRMSVRALPPTSAQEAEVHGAPTRNKAGSLRAKVLNWLPVRFRIDCKVLLLVYKSQHGFHPKHI